MRSRAAVCVLNEELMQYYDYIIVISEVLMHIFVDLVKRCVFTLADDIRRFRNDHYYYYYYYY